VRLRIGAPTWFLLCATMCSHSAFGQGCAVTLQPHFSTYRSTVISDNVITQTVTIDGYASVFPNPGCQMNNATHTPKVYNKLGSSGGWYSGTASCPTCYVHFSNIQQIVGAPGVVYTTTTDSQEVCSMAGTFFNGGQVSGKLVTLIGTNCFQNYPNTNTPMLTGVWGDPANINACLKSDTGPTNMESGGTCKPNFDNTKNCYSVNVSGSCKTYCPGLDRHMDSACQIFLDQFPVVTTVVSGTCP
jgi:hypothetical protein